MFIDFAPHHGSYRQLGHDTFPGESHTARPLKRGVSLDQEGKPSYHSIARVEQIDSGMIHCAALTSDNEVMVWGKNSLPPNVNDSNDVTARAADPTLNDARLPLILKKSWPDHLKILQIACGSHHTSMLLEDGSVWAIGVSTDTKEPRFEPIQLIPPGVVDLPVRQFAAHMDRTTVVGADGRQVLQVQLWKDPELQEVAVFTPAWIDRLLEEDPNMTVRQVHRGWIHSVVETD